jgi:hypothetical protein
LNLIYNNKATINAADGTGSFQDYEYWSSTVDVYDQKYNAWVHDFDSGSQTPYDRDTQWYYVRPVRRL